MFQRINALREKGFNPDSILDIGAHHGHWSNGTFQIYPSSKYYLFEAIDYSELNRFRGFSNINVYNILLNDKIADVDWYQMKNTGDSIFKEKTHHFVNCPVIKRKSIDLDTHIKNTQILQDAKSIFIKIDCQGAEIPILKGATEILKKTDVILLEIPLFGQYNEGVPTFLEHIQYMDSIGFTAYDITDNHYMKGFNIQIDMIFIKKTHELNKTVATALFVK